MFTGPIQLAAQDVFKTSTTKFHKLGTQAATRDGRLFRYGLASSAGALAPGKINQGPAVVANHQNVAVQTAVSVGDAQISVTLGATAMVAGDYEDGYVVGFDASGVGQTLQILTNPAALSAANVILPLQDLAYQAVTTSGKVNLEKNLWNQCAVYATGATTLFCTGVTLVSLPASSYGWFQTRGTAAVLTNGTIAAGSGVIPGQTTAGSVDIEAAATVTQRVGVAQQAGTTTKYSTTYLTID